MSTCRSVGPSVRRPHFCPEHNLKGFSGIIFKRSALHKNHNSAHYIFICLSSTGRIMWSPVVGGQAGGVPHSLSGAYIQDYASYGYEISWVDRSHQGGVQCTWTVTLACLIFELSPFVYFHTIILSGAYLQNHTSCGYEILWVDRSHQVRVQCTWTVTLACLIFELLPFVYFHTWILLGAHLQNYTSYGYEILLVDRFHWRGAWLC